jgi:NhaA family Na+:H+ antiporter
MQSTSHEPRSRVGPGGAEGSIAPPPIDQLLRPFNEFFRLEAAGGILLLVATVVALVWANSPWAGAYTGLFATKVTAGLGELAISKPLILWINDGLMAVFFFLVGLEIKREVLAGELAEVKRAALAIGAAVGGMAFPAAFYLVFNGGGAGAAGWGIPMATDIAFALGALSLLGRRAPLALKVFLTAVAIVDDIGAVLVIALFYTSKLSLAALAIGLALLGLLALMNRAGVRSVVPYAVVAAVIWVAFLKSGVHATIAGVLVAMTIPVSVRMPPGELVTRSRDVLENLAQHARGGASVLASAEQRHALIELENGIHASVSPLQRLEHALHPWVIFGIMPVFALANAGVGLGGDVASAFLNPVALGIIVGLVLGKQVGIMLAVWLLVRTGIAAIPANVTWRQIYGVAALAGIGFTMSLFIANLAFPGSPLLDVAKAGILMASLISGIVGWLALSGARPGTSPGTPRPST